MHEIEIKAVLKDGAGVRARLEVLGCTFSAPIRQEDAVYVEKAGDLPTFLSNPVFLRIRTMSNGRVLFTAKKRKEVALVAIEHETNIDSREEMEAILAMMGYSRAVQINKSRITAEHNGCEICIDEVEGLGSFIEMEKMAESDDDAAAVQEELFTFFESLGISRADRVTKGYDILMFEKLGA